MADRADSAQTLNQYRYLLDRPSLDEFFEPAELHDVQACLDHTASLIQQQGHLAVSLHTGQGVDAYPAKIAVAGTSIEISHSGAARME